LRDFRNLQVWGKNHELTLEIYRVTNSFPKHELYGVTSQIRRASVSVPANIAEGCGRSSEAELARFMQIAMGSAFEVCYFLFLTRDLGYLKQAKFKFLTKNINEIQKMLRAYITKLKANSK